ncbi:MAG: ribonuclease III [Chloroflexi bacterium]|nr:ribonuclease III [Chloroflexota bacterium]
MDNVDALQSRLRITFADPSLLHQALMHSSYLNENPQCPVHSNERLEFLGDALLGLIVAQELYLRYPQMAEGELTRLRGALVQGETLAQLAASLGLGDYLQLGHGEEASGGRQRTSNLAGALEALLGAIYLDKGFPETKEFFLKWFGPYLNKAAEKTWASDYKSQLQELLQAQRHLTPIYRVVATEGPDHAKTFTVEVVIGEEVLGRGSARGKRLAEKEAARIALETIK